MKGPFYRPRPLDRPTEVPLERGADLTQLDEAKIFAAPADPALWPAWREQLLRWRREAADRIPYGPERYEGLSAGCFVLAMANLWDGLLFDHERGEFTVDRYLETADRDFGGYDGVLLWSAYPVVGIDRRRQFDYYLEIPELPRVIEAFAERGVRTFLPYYPWATGRDAQTLQEVVECVRWAGVDGLFLDTVKEGTREFRAALDTLSPRLLMGGESRVPLARIEDHQMSWAQWFADSEVPGVLRAKWFERRHLLHHTRRWHRSHRDELHSAWFNGSGMLVWENVFGVWVGWNEADMAMLRSMRSVHRQWSEWLVSENWTPLADHPGEGRAVYASRWEYDGVPLWTVINRGPEVDGAWLVTEDRPGCTWTELTSGRHLSVREIEPGLVAVCGQLAEGGIAAVTASRQPLVLPGTGATASRTQQRVAASSPSTAAFPIRLAVRTVPPAAGRRPELQDMTPVEGGRYELTVHYRMRETGLYGETPFVDEWKPAPGSRLHYMATAFRTAILADFAIDRLEVTNRQFAEFLAATGYRPVTAGRFLTHWRDGLPTDAQLDRPVTNVEPADARAYAHWRGCRLPTEDEWQVAAAQGKLQRLEPLVWNLTESEHDDGRTRFVILKGGCSFENATSQWYFDGGPRPPEFSAKLLLLAAGLSRSPSVGFRCAVDGGSRSDAPRA